MEMISLYGAGYIRSNVKIENKERCISYECKKCNFVRHLCDTHNFNLVLRCLTYNRECRLEMNKALILF